MSLEDDRFRTVTTYPYLGQVAGLVTCRDLSELPATTEVLRMIKPYKKIERLAELTELRHLELDRLEEGWVGMLGSLPKLEELRVTGSKQEAFPALLRKPFVALGNKTESDRADAFIRRSLTRPHLNGAG